MPITINGTTGVTSPGGDTQAADTTINGVRVGRGAGAGSTNTVVGSSALNANTTGAEAAILGFQAGINNTTGSGNVYIGAYSGFTGTTAARNTAVGQAAGYSLTTGSGNTFVGTAGSSNLYGAGWRVTTGNNNTVVGAYSGNQGGLDIRTSSNQIVLSDGDGTPRLHFDSSGNLNMTTTVTSNQAGVYTTNNVFGIGANTNVRVQVNISNYGFTKFRIYGLRTNAGNSVVWWEGILNNNNNQSFTNTMTQQTSGGNISFTLSSPSAGVWNFDFNNAGSGGTGWYDKQDYGSGSVTVTTY